MVEVTVTVEYKGKNYRTNVIAHRGMPEDKIKALARKHVKKQWGSKTVK